MLPRADLKRLIERICDRVLIINDGEIVAEQTIPTNSQDGPAVVLERIADLVNGLAHSVGREPAAVGMGVPGLADLAHGIVRFLPNLPTQWRNVPVRDTLSPLIGGRPVYLLNDARMATLGELTFGQGRGVSTMAFFTLGTGIGGGVVAVPALNIIVGMPFKNAVACSSVTIVFSSAVAAIVKLLSIHGMAVPAGGASVILSATDALVIAACMVPTALVFGRLGAHLTKITPTKLVRAVFVVILVWAGYKYINKGCADYLNWKSKPAVVSSAEADSGLLTAGQDCGWKTPDAEPCRKAFDQAPTGRADA